MASEWLEKLKNAHKTCIVQDGRRKVHFTFPDKSELAEEYDMRNNELILRKWRRKETLGGDGKWEFEVGEAAFSRNLDSEGLLESNSNPIFSRKDTASKFQWRIRNLPYPLETYSVTIADTNQHIVVKTSNKKYYKKFSIPDMERIGSDLQQSKLSHGHANNTLIITYIKPDVIKDVEKQLQAEFKKLKATREGDVDCSPS